MSGEYLVGWLQLASGAFACYLAVKYVILKVLFDVTVQIIDELRRIFKK